MKVKFYRKEGGACPVKDFIKQLHPKHRKKILKDMERLEKYGLKQLLKTRDVKKIKRKGVNGLYELVTNYRRIACRTFFSIVENFYLMTHSFIKKSNSLTTTWQ